MSHMQLGFGGGEEEVGETAMANFVHVTYFSYCWCDKQEEKNAWRNISSSLSINIYNTLDIFLHAF